MGKRGRGSVLKVYVPPKRVSIASRFGLDGPGIES